jgi:hypothetical protein
MKTDQHSIYRDEEYSPGVSKVSPVKVRTLTRLRFIPLFLSYVTDSPTAAQEEALNIIDIAAENQARSETTTLSSSRAGE